MCTIAHTCVSGRINIKRKKKHKKRMYKQSHTCFWGEDGGSGSSGGVSTGSSSSGSVGGSGGSSGGGGGSGGAGAGAAGLSGSRMKITIKKTYLGLETHCVLSPQHVLSPYCCCSGSSGGGGGGGGGADADGADGADGAAAAAGQSGSKMKITIKKHTWGLLLLFFGVMVVVVTM